MQVKESEFTNPFAVRLILPLLVAISLAFGLLIPAFYDWTGSDQSRPSPLIPQTAIGITVVGLIFCIALPWMPISNGAHPTDRESRFQFTIRTILVVTALIAAFFSVLVVIPRVTSGLMFVTALVYLVQLAVRFPSYRWRLFAFLSCMYLPFVWMAGHEELSRFIATSFWVASAMPGFFFTLVIGGFLQQHALDDLDWLSILFTSIELGAGVWLIQLGYKRTIAFLVFVLICSTFGSIALNALVRM
jgi:hypothetical protein